MNLLKTKFFEAIKTISFFVLIIAFILFILSVYHNFRGIKILTKKSYEEGYIDACKDFYNGKLKYDLIKNNDGTVEWKKINHE